MLSPMDCHGTGGYDPVDERVPMLGRMYERRSNGYLVIGYDVELTNAEGDVPWTVRC